jgi:galacturonokinase
MKRKNEIVEIAACKKAGGVPSPVSPTAIPILKELRREMVKRYGVDERDVRVVRSPYRIAPLGAHIDHQLGPVTGMAIDRATFLAYVPSGSAEVKLGSLSFEGNVEFSLDSIPSRTDNNSLPRPWGNYARGAAKALTDCHTLVQGILGVTQGDMGEGGLSSSAAIGVAYLLAFEDVSNLKVSPEENIALDKALENGYIGLKNGILDQASIILSKQDSLTLINCEKVTHEIIPKSVDMPPFSVVIAFSGVRQSLVTTGYNTRVAECKEAAETLLKAAGRMGGDDQCKSPALLLGNVTREEYEGTANMRV